MDDIGGTEHNGPCNGLRQCAQLPAVVEQVAFSLSFYLHPLQRKSICTLYNTELHALLRVGCEHAHARNDRLGRNGCMLTQVIMAHNATNRGGHLVQGTFAPIKSCACEIYVAELTSTTTTR
jgi:hypothetical protein